MLSTSNDGSPLCAGANGTGSQPHLRAQEGAARRAGAGRHGRGQLRPHALPANGEPRLGADLPAGPLRRRYGRRREHRLPPDRAEQHERRDHLRRPGSTTPPTASRSAAGAGDQGRDAARDLDVEAGRRRPTSIRPDANISNIYKWIDQTEDGNTAGAALTDPELRAATAARPSAARCSTRACTSTTTSRHRHHRRRRVPWIQVAVPQEPRHLRDRRRRDLRHDEGHRR